MELTLPTFRVEVAMPHFLLKGTFQPRGDLLFYLNDRTYTYFRFDDVELLTLLPGYQVPGIGQKSMALNRQFMTYIAVLDETEAENVQVLQTKRPVVFYANWCAIQGSLHVNPDAMDDDLFDPNRDFFAVSAASIFPIRSVTHTPSSKAPFVLINRHALSAYHPQHGQG